MSVIYKKIRAALEKHLVDSSFTLPPIAWENVDFSPTTGTAFIKVQFQPTSRRPSVMGTNPQHRYQGIMTILCYSPEGSGPGTSQTVTDQLLTRFNSTTDIFYDLDSGQLLTEEAAFLITESGSRLLRDNVIYVSVEYSQQESSYINSPWYVTPITVAWYVYS
jgi:hypothetical protein